MCWCMISCGYVTIVLLHVQLLLSCRGVVACGVVAIDPDVLSHV